MLILWKFLKVSMLGPSIQRTGKQQNAHKSSLYIVFYLYALTVPWTQKQASAQTLWESNWRHFINLCSEVRHTENALMSSEKTVMQQAWTFVHHPQRYVTDQHVHTGKDLFPARKSAFETPMFTPLTYPRICTRICFHKVYHPSWHKISFLE